MPCMPISDRASLMSSSLNGLTIASTFFILISRVRFIQIQAPKIDGTFLGNSILNLTIKLILCQLEK